MLHCAVCFQVLWLGKRFGLDGIWGADLGICHGSGMSLAKWLILDAWQGLRFSLSERGTSPLGVLMCVIDLDCLILLRCVLGIHRD